MRPPEHDQTRDVRAAVTLDRWRLYLDQLVPVDETDPALRKKAMHTRKVAFQRAREALAGNDLIGAWGEWFWLPSR